MKKDRPEIFALKKLIEESVNRKIKTPADFDFLTGIVWERLHETISSSTLKRLWGYIDGADTTRESTLNLLSRCVDFENFDAFLKHLKEQSEDESDFCITDNIKSSDLNVGDRIEVGWQPNRLCIFCYIGDNRFMVEFVENAKLKVGDLFSCSIFMKGELLYIDNLVRDKKKAVSYIAGSKNGITLLKKLSIK